MVTVNKRTETCRFSIAEFSLIVIFKDVEANGFNLIPSFRNFKTDENNEELLLTMTVEDDDYAFPESAENIGTFDTGNGDTIVDRLSDGGYKFKIKDIDGDLCCTLTADRHFNDCHCTLNGEFWMRRFGLNNAFMLAFAFAGSFKKTLMIHASLVRNNGYGYAFIAKSGTGKSTHTSLWLRHIPGSDLMNDDNPIVRVIDGKPYIYGSPWSGKTPCYRQVKASLGAITRIDRAKQNSIEKLKPIQAFASLLPCCSSMKWDKEIYNAICDTITRLIETTDIFTLHCLPDKEAAEICHKTISK